MDREVGSPETGKEADPPLFRRRQPHPMPDARLINNLVYSGGNNMADTVIVGGRIILTNGRSTVFDEEAVIAVIRDSRDRGSPGGAAEDHRGNGPRPADDDVALAGHRAWAGNLAMLRTGA